MTGTVHQHPASAPSPNVPQPSHGAGGGNGHDLHARVSVLESRMNDVATKKDISDLKVYILAGVIFGVIIVAGLALTFARVVSLILVDP